MSWSSRRATLVLAVATIIAGVSILDTANAQRVARQPAQLVKQPGKGKKGKGGVPPKGGPFKRESYDLGSLTLPKDDQENLTERLEAAEDNIKRAVRGGPETKEHWARALRSLQELVGRPQDVFVPRDRKAADGTITTHYVSVKKEAARLIGGLPKEGRTLYEATFGGRARKMYQDSKTNNRVADMALALALYLHTEAGADAAVWLGTYYLDRAEFQAATRFFSQLIQRGGVQQVHPRTLLKAAYAFHMAGDKAGGELVFKELERRGIEFKLREESLTVAEVRDTIGKLATNVSLQSASDSPVYRGRPNRTAMLPGGTPFLEAAWRQKMWKSDAARDYVQQAERALQTANKPILSAYVPVTATVNKGGREIPLLIFRSNWGVHAVNMKSGKLEWDSPSDWSLDRVMGAVGRDRDSYKVSAYSNWLSHWLSTTARPQVLLDNSSLGTLSADSRFVYAVEDLPVAPPAHLAINDPGRGIVNNFGPGVAAAIGHNKLQAFELATGGKLKWELGGMDDKTPLSETYFMGPPLPLNGRLYVLTEKKQELRLLTLDPATGKVLGAQSLANTKDIKLASDPLRRMQACHLAYGEGILVIPTNAGAVFGVDLLSNSLLWAYPYRESSGTPAVPPGGGVGLPGRRLPPGWVIGPDGRAYPPGTFSATNTHWLVTAPAIAEGKVVFTAPDAKGIHCVNIRDGNRLWSLTRRDDDLYMAGVFNGKVVIVGKTRTRALSLTRGDTLWELETGTPSGQGTAAAPNVAGDIIYYLPIRQAVQTREPEVCAINIDRGLIHAHTRSRKKEVPGNLLFYEGNVLSQTHTEVVAYPQLEVKLQEMDRLVRANPNDPVALTERGDYLLDKGDLPGAITDFRKAIRQEKIPRETMSKARQKLYEAFTEHFQRDFGKAEEFLKEYEEICKVDLAGTVGEERTRLMAEQRRRRANFLCLVGKGREAQGRLVEAFERYMELGAEARPDELIQVVDEPSVRAAPDVWSQGRIAAMVERATDVKQKEALEALIVGRWKKLKATRTPPLEDLRKFVALFGSLFGVGREARMTLAERLMEDTDLNSLLEAEQQLSLMRGDPDERVAAQAVEALARLNTRKGLLEDAAYYYRLLGERYPKVVVDGKRGEEYLDDLATDKRFLPYLDQAGRYVIRGKVDLRHQEERGNFPYTAQSYQFAHDGEALPFFVRNKLSLRMDYSHALKLTDSSTGESRWSLNLTRTQFQTLVQGNTQPHRARFAFQSLGHLVVLQLGHMVYGVDPLNKGRVLWERNLSTIPGTTMPYWTGQPTVDPRDGSVVVVYPDGWMQRLGSTGPLQGGVICLQTRDALTAIDPVTGRTLWTRTDVQSRSHVFGDEQHIYVVGMSGSNSATGTRVFRAYDGVSVKAPDFSRVYDQRVRMIGRNILASETDVRGTLTLRIYDVLAGRELWRQVYNPGTKMLQSEDPALCGVVESDGTVRVLDVRTQKEVLSSKLVDRAHLDKVQSVHLVTDPDYLYVAINATADVNQVLNGSIHSNLMSNAGLRSLPVNGYVYSFSRKTGKVQWYNPVEAGHMVLSLFEDMPAVLFTSRYQKWQGGVVGRHAMNVTVARAFAKHNGKLWYDNDSIPYGMYFHALSMDNRTGKIELTGNLLRVTLTAQPK